MKLSFRKVLGVAFIIAALICIYFAFLQQEKYIQGNAEYKKIKQTATDTPSDDSKHTQDFQVDWNTLKTQNPDIVGWIRMDPKFLHQAFCLFQCFFFTFRIYSNVRGYYYQRVNQIR